MEYTVSTTAQFGFIFLKKFLRLKSLTSSFNFESAVQDGCACLVSAEDGGFGGVTMATTSMSCLKVTQQL